MTPERLASMCQYAIAFDLETHLIQPGLLAPDVVLGSAAEYNHQWDVYQDALQQGDPNAAALACSRFNGVLLDKHNARGLFRQILDDPRRVIMGANIVYDFLVMAVDFAKTFGEDIMPKLFAMYDPHGTVVRGVCDSRVFEVQLAEALHAIAQGHLGKHARTLKQFINKKTGRPGRYSLDTVTFEVTGREDAKLNDRFRLNYALFDNAPLESLPHEARQYPVDDAINTCEDGLAQAGFLPSSNPHQFIATSYDAPMICRFCYANASDPNAPLDCMRRQPRRNLHDLGRQGYAAWALHLGAAWGFQINQAKVDALEKRITDRLQAESAPFIEAGIIRADGTENQAVLKRLVAIAYGARNECPTCHHPLNLDKKQRPCPPGKVASPQTGNPINCPSCDGTGLELPPNVPRSEGGGVSKNRDTLQESGDELLMAYGEQEGQKILSTYVPLMRKARACNVCGESGAGKHPHKDWCSAMNGEQGYRPIPLILSPNPLVETGRCSYENGVHGLPRKGGVRECFEARPGYVLSSEDYTAGELVTHADNCIVLVGYSRLADALNGGLDAHLALAGTMLGMTYEDILKIKKEALAKDNRQAAKAANFGFPGGMAELTFVLRKRSDPDLFTPCPNGPDEHKGVRGYKGMRPCILMGGMDRCGVVKVTSYNDQECPPVCLKCVENAKKLRGDWFEQWPENNPRDGYFSKIKRLLETPGPSGTSEIVHLGSNRIRGGVGFCDGANGLFQGKLSDAAKDAYCQVVRECYDRTWRVRSSEMMTSRFDGGESPLYGSRAIMLAHDETIAEHPESVASEAAMRVSEIMVESLRWKCPRLYKACKAEPTLMRFLAKGAEPRYARGGDKPADEYDRLIPWEPEAKAA